MDPISALDDAIDAAPSVVDAISTLAELEAVEVSLLGKDSPVGVVRQSMGKLDHGDRPKVGARLNEATQRIGELLGARRQQLGLIEEAERLRVEAIDVTLESVTFPAGSLHLVQQTIDEVVDIFIGLGYQVASGPEAELAWYNFDALNTPPTHPSRWESDTMYLDWGDPRR